jgi:uncharacterized membrane protein
VELGRWPRIKRISIGELIMSHSSKNRRTEKRERFAHGHPKRRINPSHILAALGTLLVLALAYLAVSGPSKSSAATVVTPVAGNEPNSAEIRIPLAEVSDQAKFYEYQAASQKKVRFFVIKSSDGVYRAAADACDVCYREKMGYHQEGNDMVCNKCNRHFRSADVNVITGSCNPDGIPRTIQGDKLLIAASELEARAELF